MFLRYLFVCFTGILLVACNPEPAADSAEETAATPAETATANALRGLYVSFADAPIFIDCSFEKRYPVAMEGAHGEVEQGYLDLKQTPTPALITVEGRFEERKVDEGAKTTFLVIDKLISLEGDKTCGEF